MIDGVNDSGERDGRLASIREPAPRAREPDSAPLTPRLDGRAAPSHRSRIDAFVRVLEAGGVTVTVRDTRGRGIDAACGQLHLAHASRPV